MLIGLATSESPLTFFVASFLIGLCATGAQVLLPFAAHFIPEERRGQVVGNIMAGVLTGHVVGSFQPDIDGPYLDASSDAACSSVLDRTARQRASEPSPQ